MLRMMLRCQRRVIANSPAGIELEPWVDWIKRTTHAGEERLSRLGMRDWVASHWETTARWQTKLDDETFTDWAYWGDHWTPEGR